MASSSEHLVRSFDQQLRRLSQLLTDMGGIVENQLAQARQAILNHDSEAATSAMEADPRVDALERDVDQFVIRLLALRQPMADDLRHIVAGLKIAAALERIGDYAKNVSKRSLVLNQFSLPFSLGAMAHMMQLVQQNLKLMIDAIGENSAEKAVQVWNSDQPIDDMYDTIFRELITYMMEDPRNITPCTHLLFIAKNLERIGDHTTNIAEIVYYAVTGENMPEDRPKGESASYSVAGPKA